MELTADIAAALRLGIPLRNLAAHLGVTELCLQKDLASWGILDVPTALRRWDARVLLQQN